MLKSAAGVVAGYVLWSVLWLLYNAALKKLALLPTDTTISIQGKTVLLLLLAGSIVMSALAGYINASIAGSTTYAPVITLGLLLLATGIFFQAQYWHLMPLWYHLSFLLLLLPLCLVGARLHLSRS